MPSSTEPAAGSTAQKLEAVLTQAQPYIAKAVAVIDTVAPYVEQAVEKGQQLWKQLEPYHPEELLPALFGVALMFFGGTFMTLAAAFEAYRLIGWRDTADALQLLWRNYKAASEANRKDDAVDADGDGVADVKQIDTGSLILRKTQLVLKSTDPQQVEKAAIAITNGFMAVVVSLRIRFAKAIALGVTIADIIEANFGKFLDPVLEQVVPKDYHKWLPMLKKYSVRSIGVSVAWWLARIVSAAHSGVRGAELMVGALVTYAIRHKYVSEDISKHGGIFQMAGLGLALLGFWTQLSGGFSLPFPLNILFLPVSMAEWFLMYFVGVGDD